MDRQYKPGAGTLITSAPANGIAGTPGKQTLVEAEVARGFGAGSPIHATPAAPRVAERARAPLNAVLKVVAYDAHGNVLRSWGAKATWDGKLPQHFHGDHSRGGWRWDDATSARTVRVHTRADGSGGESVDAWAGTLHAARVEIFAEPIDAVTERAQARPDNVRDPKAAKLEKTPRGYSWHHDESDMGMMYLVPDDLHQAIRHSGGVAEHRHRHGITEYD